MINVASCYLFCYRLPQCKTCAINIMFEQKRSLNNSKACINEITELYRPVAKIKKFYCRLKNNGVTT